MSTTDTNNKAATIVQNFRKGTADRRRLLKKGAINWQGDIRAVELISDQHPDQKVREIAAAYTQMLSHPLVKRYLRKKPKLYLVLDGYRTNLPEAVNISNDCICITQPELEAGLAYAKMSLGHELAESMTLAGNFRRLINPELSHQHRIQERPGEYPHFVCPDAQNKETMCDIIGMALSGEIEEAKQWVLASCDNVKNAFRRHNDEFNAEMHGRPNPLYYDTEIRQQKLSKAAGKMATEDGKKEIFDMIATYLDTEHRKLFPHHYSRPGGVTRG